MKQTIKLLVIISVVNLVVVSVVTKMTAKIPNPTNVQDSKKSGFTFDELSQKEKPVPSPIAESPTPKPTVKATTSTIQIAPTPTPTSTPTPAPIVDNRCIITIDGAKYDVTQFRNAHSGGDIFACGADMSGDFWGQHGQRELKKMQSYRI